MFARFAYDIHHPGFFVEETEPTFRLTGLVVAR